VDRSGYAGYDHSSMGLNRVDSQVPTIPK
jgi:hypothetical protein